MIEKLTKYRTAAHLTPRELRGQCRDGVIDHPTSGYGLGFIQANVVILPHELAEDFRWYCERNPKPCPILEILEPGNPEPRHSAPGADIRSDVPLYRVFRDGAIVGDPSNIVDIWRDDLVTFLLGCSFSAEDALLSAGVPMRQFEEGEPRAAAAYRTNVETEAVGPFSGPLVVTMRAFQPADADRATEITSQYPMAHGGPVHRGDPAALGIEDLMQPTYLSPVSLRPNDDFLYWACGATPQEVIAKSRIPFAITHKPAHMFFTDVTTESTRITA